MMLLCTSLWMSCSDDDDKDPCSASENVNLVDTDKDGIVDNCDEDDDNDGILDEADNCPLIPNADQLDIDQDGIGDVCDEEVIGRCADDSFVISFTDPLVESTVRTELGKSTGDITCGDAKTVKVLDFGNAGVSNLEGLEYFVNLEELNLFGNNVEDISSLASLTKLKFLSLAYNPLANTDLSPLLNMVEMEAFVSINSQVQDISALKNMKKLTYLMIFSNAIKDLSPLDGMTELENLMISGNPLEGSLNALGSMKKLEKLSLSNCNLNNDQLEELSNGLLSETLTNLTLGGNNFNNPEVLENLNLPNLLGLSLYENDISIVPLLSKLTKLETLDIDESGVSNIENLSVLTSLKDLSLGKNQIEDVTPLYQLSNLTLLMIYENPIVEVKKQELREKLPNCYITF